MQENQKTVKQSLIVLSYLKPIQYQDLGFQSLKFQGKINIFPSILISPFRIFVIEGKYLLSAQEFYEYLQCVYLEGDLKRILILIDGSLQEEFISKYNQIIFNEIYKEIYDIFIIDPIQKDNCIDLQKYYKNITKVTDKNKGFFLNILKNANNQKKFINNLSHKIIVCEEKTIESIKTKIKEEIEKLNKQQQDTIKDFDQNCLQFIDFRNSIISQTLSNAITNRNILILQFKFNYAIMEQISLYTSSALEQIFKWIQKFQKSFFICHKCKFWGYQSGTNILDCILFNGHFKNRACQNCSNSIATFDELKTQYDEFKSCFQIDHFLKQLNQNQSVQLEKIIQQTPKKDINNFNHHIILIGKTGVGKTRLFNLLCDGKIMRFNEPTQKPTMKKCLNSKLTVLDTPPFELENSETTKQMFSDILIQQKISQIFIVVKYERLAVMKQNWVYCIKFLHPFIDKISLIIFNDEESQIKEDQNTLENTFENQRLLICNFRSQPEILNKNIENHILKIGAKLDQLKIENTPFDAKRNENEIQDMISTLKSLKEQEQKQPKMKILQEQVQALIQQNDNIVQQIDVTNQKLKELLLQQNQNNKQIQTILQSMLSDQYSKRNQIAFD